MNIGHRTRSRAFDLVHCFYRHRQLGEGTTTTDNASAVPDSFAVHFARRWAAGQRVPSDTERLRSISKMVVVMQQYLVLTHL